MKFSWKLLNEFIDLRNTETTYFEEKLTLSGIEIENTKNHNNIQDKIINFNITSNRKELSSIINLAKEISSILNLPLKVKPLNIITHAKNARKYKQIIELSQQIFYCKLNFLTNLVKNPSPQWLTSYLKICNIEPNNLFHDIQNYIQIKWGHKISILDTNNLKQDLARLKIITEENSSFSINSLKNTNFLKKKDSKLLIFYIYENRNHHKLYYNYTEYSLNAYNEAINIITTYTKSTISKSYNQWNPNYSKDYMLKVNKNKVYNTLGTIQNRPFKFLSTINILSILEQLNFYPRYIKNLKALKICIPIHRLHDLKRDIDIIEEIGRIYGFKYFLDPLPLNKSKGFTSNMSQQTKKIRYILRNLGFNEVINSSLIKNNNRTITLYNPVTKEQQALRKNIIENLLENYNYNIKHKNFRVEIFEIGKIFENSNSINKKYIEKTNVAGLICNNNFIRRKWSNKSESINWFHMKGIIETLLEQLNSKVTLKKISQEENNIYLTNTNHLLHSIKRMGIYNLSNQQPIGVLGELNKQFKVKLHNSNNPIYLFEINIEELTKSQQTNRNLNINAQKYSYYPSVTRDVSLRMKKHENIDDIKRTILKMNEMLTESVEVFNEYYDQLSDARFIGLRITYKAYDRTLNNKDIKKIDNDIENLLNKLEEI